jgi:hypothetical protein
VKFATSALTSNFRSLDVFRRFDRFFLDAMFPPH